MPACLAGECACGWVMCENVLVRVKKYSVEFYWDLALSQAIVEAEDD